VNKDLVRDQQLHQWINVTTRSLIRALIPYYKKRVEMNKREKGKQMI